MSRQDLSRQKLSRRKVPRHFLTLLDCSPEELTRLVARAIELKRLRQEGVVFEPLKGRTLAMVFAMSSTRTRVAFEAGMQQLGGHAIFLSPDDTQLGRGEPVEDTAHVLSEMVDAVMIRTPSQDQLEAFARASSVPPTSASACSRGCARRSKATTGWSPSAARA